MKCGNGHRLGCPMGRKPQRLRIVCQHLGANISKARRQKRWTQDQAAEYLGFSVRHYQRLERGKVIPSLALVVAVAALFGIPEDELFRPAELEKPRPGRPRPKKPGAA